MIEPLSVIIVEDQALLAMQLRYVIEDAGHIVAGCIASLDEAVALTSVKADLALVDVHLADGPTGVEVAALLHERAVRIVFVTANVKRIPDGFADAVGVIAKPYTSHGILAALDFVGEGVRSPPPRLKPPTGLKLSPAYEDRWRSTG